MAVVETVELEFPPSSLKQYSHIDEGTHSHQQYPRAVLQSPYLPAGCGLFAGPPFIPHVAGLISCPVDVQLVP